MVLEKMKSFVLAILVITSIFLTTQLWFDVSIKGIFVMPESNEVSTESFAHEYDKFDLVKPNRIIVNLGEKGMHAMLLDKSDSASVYERIFEETRKAMKEYMNNDGIEGISKYNTDKLESLRNGRNIELLFENGIDADVLASIMEIPRDMVKDINKVDSFIISPSDSRLYISDFTSNMVFEYKLKRLETVVSYMISLTESISNPYCVFLNEAYPELYSKKVVVPISMNSYKLPILSAKKETELGNGVEHIVNKFFDFKTARSMTDKSGTTIYTDGQSKSVRIDKSGVVEYMKYDAEGNYSAVVAKDEAVKISIDFISKHLGFPEGTYISSIEEKQQNGNHIGYKIGFRYGFSKTPVVFDSNMEGSPIEVEVIGREVRRYKRLVRSLQNTQDQKLIKNPIDVLNTIYKNISSQSGVENTTVNNMYLGYYEYKNHDNTLLMIPAWIVEIEQKGSSGEKLKRQYVINAETSVILKY